MIQGNGFGGVEGVELTESLEAKIFTVSVGLKKGNHEVNLSLSAACFYSVEGDALSKYAQLLCCGWLRMFLAQNISAIRFRYLCFYDRFVDCRGSLFDVNCSAFLLNNRHEIIIILKGAGGESGLSEKWIAFRAAKSGGKNPCASKTPTSCSTKSRKAAPFARFEMAPKVFRTRFSPSHAFNHHT